MSNHTLSVLVSDQPGVLARVASAHPGETTVVVGHGLALRVGQG